LEAVRDQFCRHHRLGERSGLVREERHLQQALKERYYDPRDLADDLTTCQPSPETSALFEKPPHDLDARLALTSRPTVDAAVAEESLDALLHGAIRPTRLSTDRRRVSPRPCRLTARQLPILRTRRTSWLGTVRLLS